MTHINYLYNIMADVISNPPKRFENENVNPIFDGCRIVCNFNLTYNGTSITVENNKVSAEVLMCIRVEPMKTIKFELRSVNETQFNELIDDYYMQINNAKTLYVDMKLIAEKIMSTEVDAKGIDTLIGHKMLNFIKNNPGKTYKCGFSMGFDDFRGNECDNSVFVIIDEKENDYHGLYYRCKLRNGHIIKVPNCYTMNNHYYITHDEEEY